MKTLTIAGRVGKDAVLRHTNGGDTVLGFSVAVDDGYGEQKSTLWFDCSVWGKRAAALAPHITKGTALAASGELSTRQHEDKTYLTLRVAELTLQGGGEKKEASKTKAAENRDDPRTQRNDRELDDEIPF
jgi:single-strand DNA-binding protein